MNWLDILIIISLIISLVGGLVTGFIRSLLATIGIIAGIIIAGYLYSDLAAHLSFINHEGTANVLAFAFLFCATLLLTAIVGQIMRMIVIRIMLLEWLDRLLGGIAGLFAGIIFWGFLMALWAKFFGGSALESSLFAPFLATKFPLVLTLLPPEFDSVREFFR